MEKAQTIPKLIQEKAYITDPETSISDLTVILKVLGDSTEDYQTGRFNKLLKKDICRIAEELIKRTSSYDMWIMSNNAV